MPSVPPSLPMPKKTLNCVCVCEKVPTARLWLWLWLPMSPMSLRATYFAPKPFKRPWLVEERTFTSAGVLTAPGASTTFPATSQQKPLRLVCGCRREFRIGGR